MSPTDKFNKANQNFKKLYYSGKARERRGLPNKYKWLPDWTLSKSNYLLHEHENINKKVYSRGAIVNINLGVNIGQELSGNHFGIVLNKHDNKRNDKLTIIPLTSHEHTHTVELDKTILNLSFSSFIKFWSERLIIMYSLYYLNYNALKDVDSTIKGPEENLRNIFSSLEDTSKPNSLYQLTIAKVPDYESAVNLLKKQPVLKEHSDNLLKFITENDFNKQQVDLVDELNQVFTRYQKYNKKTWAKIADIQTISKSRLIRINSMDPIGDIKVSPIVLDTIDQEIIRQLTNINLDS
ncbi:hypothetical protein [Levilactobacillus brevis]|uniref:hypothetical protein n=1 Tax=Levilactobacillus brevis TaxID=1580 RepID=UPI0020747873|nr:hypothetical protein [Levilactobacillus brevis]